MAIELRDPPLSEVARLTDPFFYGSEPWDIYARLRREAPVFWDEQGQLWGITKYEDIKYISRNPDLFSSQYGLVPTESIPVDDGSQETPGAMPRRAELRRQIILSKFGPGSELLPASDPPRHNVLRKLVGYAFTPKLMTRLEVDIAQLTDEALDDIEPGAELDLVESVAARIPVQIIAQMLGVPRQDWGDLKRWSDSVMAAMDYIQDQQSEQYLFWMTQMFELAQYFIQALAERRENPRDDLLTALTQAEVDGDTLSLENQLTMTAALLFGGNDTTRNLIAGSIRALGEYPDQRALLVKDPDLMPTAIDELLRWVSPVLTFCRTAMADTEIRGQAIKKGDFVTMVYPAAHRDEEAWDRADELDLTRDMDPMHLAFGFGQHYCIGAALGRRAGKIVLEKFLARFPNYELAGPIERTPSTSSICIKSMPVRVR